MTFEEVRALFDYRDGHLFRKSNGKHIGSLRWIKGKMYSQLQYAHKTYMTHRVIFLWHHGYLPEVVDHINRDPSDNHIENLRAATYITNNQNACGQCNSKTGIKNVTWVPEKRAFRVALNVAKKRVHVGYFTDIDLAELTATEARDLYHGRFACHAAS